MIYLEVYDKKSERGFTFLASTCEKNMSTSFMPGDVLVQ